MTKKILFLLATPILAYTMDAPNDGLDLVSIAWQAPKGFPMKQLWEHNRQPLRDTITTIDTQPHRQKFVQHMNFDDICTRPFKANSINSVYLEEPSTSHLIQAINNVSKGMRPGAAIEIELHPASKIPCNPLKRFMQFGQLFNDSEKDPFIAKIDINLFFTAFDILFNGVEVAKQNKKEFNVQVSPTFINHAVMLSETIENLLTFYEQQEIGKKKLLKQHLLKEMLILQSFAEKPKIIFLYHGPQSGPENFLREENTDRSIPIEPETQRFIDDLFFIGGIMPDGRRGYTEDMFIPKTLANFLLCDAFVHLNQDAMKKFMIKNGFIHPAVEKKTSSYSGHNNVWIISAIKA